MEYTQEKETRSYSIRFSARDQGKEVGRARLYIIYNDLHEQACGLMEDVFVEDGYRKQGIGTHLVQMVIDEAKKQGCYKLLGQSRYGRVKVHEMYIKMGFKDHGKNFRMDFPS
jgi:GNAT superfamily N-acetyltransferase